MRKMSWERAKGELKAVLSTYEVDSAAHNDLKVAFKGLINSIEESGIIEVPLKR